MQIFKPPGYWSATAIAKKLNVDKETVRRWCRQGKLQAQKLAKEWLILDHDFSAFLEQRDGTKK
jgi:excisionase family DNA binding protein